jgi:hypothetical protein
MPTRFAISLTVALTIVLLLAAVAHASCISLTAAQQRARADVIFDGIALENPTATGMQRFRVTRFLKGRGPKIVRVQTGNTLRPDGSGTTTSVSLFVKRGERWRIFARGSARRTLRTSVCDGSRRLR